MKHPLLIALAALAALTPVHSSARDFSYTYEGQTITYTVLDEDTKTVETKQGEIIYASSGNNVSGNLALPAHPMDGDVEYTLTTIGKYAFYYCISLTSVEIPNSVTTIGEEAFAYCRSLTSVEIPNSVTTIGERAFNGCSALTEINVGSGNQYYSSEDGVLFNYDKTIIIRFPEGKGGYSYTIPNSVNVIEESAFNSCDNLTSVEIPNSVKIIGEKAFYGTALTKVEIPNSVTAIGNSAFSGCRALTSVEMLNSVTTIGESAFSGTALTSVEIPNSVTTIGELAFSGTALTSVEIPNSVTFIGERAFNGCRALTEINVDSENQYYSSEDGVLFNKNKSDLIQYPAGKEGSYNIPNTVTAIGIYAFYYCSALTNIEIPNSVTTIGDWAFLGSALTNIEIPNSVTSIGYWAFGGCRFGHIEIPNTISTIEAKTFFSCSALTSLKIPNSVKTIGESAFRYCWSLPRVEIPNSVTSIGEEAFAGCSALTNVICLATIPPIVEKSAFEKYSRDSYLYVPAASVSAYENSDWAQYFTGIKAINNPTGVDEVGAPDSGVRVSVWQNTVTITGLEPGARVSVHDVAGNMVYAGNEHSLTLPAGQAYIVSTPSKTFKVVL